MKRTVTVERISTRGHFSSVGYNILKSTGEENTTKMKQGDSLSHVKLGFPIDGTF